ncbi:MAG: TrkA family potassium uptake protein [Haloferacaceae archaeon]
MPTLPRSVDGTTARRRTLLYVGLVVAAILGYTVLYRYGMARLEGTEVSFLEALNVVVESMTTTGYGEDAQQWTTDGMLALTIAMQLTGVVLIFLTLPLFLVPLVEESLRTDPPTETDRTDHVVICQFSPRGETLVAELESRDVPYVVVVPDRDEAVSLHEEGVPVVHGDPESTSVLRAAGAPDALALVADADDETNASIVLSAREAAPDLRVVTLVEDPRTADYHRYAGADHVASPRHLLGESLASKAATAVRTDVGDAIEISDDFEIVELMVQRDSRLVGETVADSGVGATGANVIGAWFRGEFVSPPRPDDVIDEHTVLLVAGREANLERLKELTLSETRQRRRGTVVVAGYGEVGSTVADALAAADVPTVVVDRQEKPGVDVVGDVTDRSTLAAADVAEARSVILALDDDTTATFATLAVSRFAPDVEIIARANEPDSTTKLYRAGAEYVLALATVSGRILASTLLDEEVIAPDTQVEVVRTTASGLVGETLASADVRARTNCTVIAAERNGDLLTDVGPDFRIQRGDVLVVAGLDEDVNAFNELATGT